MREYSLSLTDAGFLDKGLRPSYRNRKDSGFLSDCMNIQGFDTGLGPFEPIQNPLSYELINSEDLHLNWPFPQFFRGREYIFLVDRTRIYLVNDSDWSLVELEIYDFDNPSQLGTIVPGTSWQFIDFGECWFFVNGVSTVLYTGRHPLLGESDKVYVTNQIRINAGCAFAGRSWLGGFNEGYFYSDAWETLLNNWITRTASGIAYPVKGLRQNAVWFSTIGGGDLLDIFSLSLAKTGITTSSYGSEEAQYKFFDVLYRNEAGIMPMPWPGAVRQLLPLDKFNIVYGDNGVSALVPVETIVGLRDLNIETGIHNTGAVSGNNGVHLWIDSTCAMWIIDRGLSPQRLGFEEYLSSLQGTEIIVSGPDSRGYFYISNGYRAFSYYMPGKKMTEHGQMITSVFAANGENVGFCTMPGDIDNDWYCTSDILSFKYPGLKQVTWVEIDCSIPATTYIQSYELWASVLFRLKQRGSFVESRRVAVNQQGFAKFFVTGYDFMIRVGGNSFRDQHITDVRVRWQAMDKRFIRGPLATEVV